MNSTKIDIDADDASDSLKVVKPKFQLSNLPQRPPVNIEFQDIVYSVPQGRKGRGDSLFIDCANAKFNFVLLVI